MYLQKLMLKAAGVVVIPLVALPMSSLRAQDKAGDVKADRRFIHEVAADNLLEVQLGKLAEKKAQNADVKQFGQRMVTDQTKMEDQWTDLAKKNGMAFKPALGPRHERKLDRLQKVSGKEFDRAYMTTMIQQYKDEEDYFQTEKQSASSPVRDLIADNLPSLDQHLTQAKEIGSKVGADTTVTGRARHVTATRKKK